jgi:hypothetical protein
MCAVYLEEREEEEVKRVCLHFYDTQQLLLLFRLREAKGRLSNICESSLFNFYKFLIGN